MKLTMNVKESHHRQALKAAEALQEHALHLAKTFHESDKEAEFFFHQEQVSSSLERHLEAVHLDKGKLVCVPCVSDKCRKFKTSPHA